MREVVLLTDPARGRTSIASTGIGPMGGQSCQVCFGLLLCCYGNAMINSRLDFDE